MATGPTTKLADPAGHQRRGDRSYISNHRVQRVRPGHQRRGADHDRPTDSVLDPSLGHSAKLPSPDVPRPRPDLARAGVKTPLSLTVKMVAGYTDYLSDLQIIQQELKPVAST